MESMVHTRSNADGDIGPVAESVNKLRIWDQVINGIGESLGLKNLGIPDVAMGANDAVTGASQECWIDINGSSAGFERSDKGIV